MCRWRFCAGDFSPALLAQADDLRPTIWRLIRTQCPNWAENEDICPSCTFAYARRDAAACRVDPVHTRTFLHTTFPYDNSQEASIHSRSVERNGRWKQTRRSA